MMWVVIGYVLGIIATLVALFFLLARLISFFIQLPRALDNLVDDVITEFVTAIFAILVLGLTAGASGLDLLHPGPLESAAIVAAMIDLFIIGLFAAIAVIFFVVGLVVLFIILPLAVFEAITGRQLEHLASIILLILAFYLGLLGTLALAITATDAFILRVPEWLIDTASMMLVVGLPLLAMLGAAIIGVIALGRLVTTMIPPRDRPWRRRAVWNDESAPVTGQSFADRTRDLARSAISDAATLLSTVGGDGERPVFHGTDRRAREVAADRESFVRRQLHEYRISLPTAEILEIPPSLRGTVVPREMDQYTADARLTALLYQGGQEEALLFGRLIDTIHCFTRVRVDRFPSLTSLAGTELLLRKLRWWERRSGEYSWIALVRTRYADEFTQFLDPLKEWLGIGVRIVKPVGWRRQRTCANSNELGTVAGYLATSNPDVKYSLTCAHVLPPSCLQTRITRTAQSSGVQPDAALLHQHPCVGVTPRGVSARFASRRLLRRLWVAKTSVYRAGGYSHKVIGYVKNEHASYVADDEAVEDFPACIVQTKRFRYVWGAVPWPLVRARFSDEGDSGSWVMVRDPARWLGMVAAGGKGDDKMETYVIKASALNSYFRRRLKTERPIVPFLTEDF